eukprot:scaffold94_cov340-Prasinococcus_capsulatus_cf.AAC.15
MSTSCRSADSPFERESDRQEHAQFWAALERERREWMARYNSKRDSCHLCVQRLTCAAALPCLRPSIVADLRSNHAGETGAVYIYAGAQQAMAWRRRLYNETRLGQRAAAFAAEHKATEQRHLRYFDRLLPERQRSALLPLWRSAGFALGFVPSLVGPNALFVTVESVEQFVEQHYTDQIEPLERAGQFPALAALLRECCSEEVHHKEEARALRPSSRTALMADLWGQVIATGGYSARTPLGGSGRCTHRIEDLIDKQYATTLFLAAPAANVHVVH